MELREYFKILKKNLAFIIFLAILGSVVAYSMTANFTGGQRAQKHYLLVVKEVSGREFGGPLVIHESVDLTDTTVALVQSADFKKEILKGQENLIVKKEAPRVLNLEAQAETSQRAYEIILQAAANFNSKAAFIFERDSEIRLVEVGSSYEPLGPAFDKKVTSAFGFLAGATFAIFVIGLATYFKV